jgi:hypothetical protein
MHEFNGAKKFLRIERDQREECIVILSALSAKDPCISL